MTLNNVRANDFRKLLDAHAHQLAKPCVVSSPVLIMNQGILLPRCLLMQGGKIQSIYYVTLARVVLCTLACFAVFRCVSLCFARVSLTIKMQKPTAAHEHVFIVSIKTPPLTTTTVDSTTSKYRTGTITAPSYRTARVPALCTYHAY